MERCRVTISPYESGAYTVVFIGGALNLFTARDVRAQMEPLLKEERVRVVVDIEGLDTIDSSGIGALVNFILAARKHADARVVFTQPNEIVMRVFEITKLKSFFEIVDDLEAAKVIILNLNSQGIKS
ncbi:MAG TPA: STAS domain-containing protein [Turneriella sp.]|nr:STAS domain-containing protein [Turneriella sp.]